MAPLPAARFASAEEMSVQLRGVLRELRSLRLGAETFEPSPLFATAPAALDGALGKAPPLDQWRQGGNRKRKLSSTRPTPPEVALGLPVPRPDDSDRNRTELQRTSYDDPAGLLQLSEVWRESPERALLRCRLHLEIARDHPAEAARELRRAERELALAATAVGEPAAHDWRLDWHHGLLWLSRGEVTPALECFTRVNAAIPGEYAPKLAMGYCQEFGDNPKEAVRLYGAVWQRNRALGGAAFGLARIHVGHGKPQLALDCLEAVPADSRHRTAARTAMVRILADPPDGDARPTPQAAARAWVAMHRLTLRRASPTGTRRNGCAPISWNSCCGWTPRRTAPGSAPVCGSGRAGHGRRSPIPSRPSTRSWRAPPRPPGCPVPCAICTRNWRPAI